MSRSSHIESLVVRHLIKLETEVQLFRRLNQARRSQLKAFVFYNKINHVRRICERCVEELERYLSMLGVDTTRRDGDQTISEAHIAEAVIQLPRTVLLLNKLSETIEHISTILYQQIDLHAFIGPVAVYTGVIARILTISKRLKKDLDILLSKIVSQSAESATATRLHFNTLPREIRNILCSNDKFCEVILGSNKSRNKKGDDFDSQFTNKPDEAKKRKPKKKKPHSNDPSGQRKLPRVKETSPEKKSINLSTLELKNILSMERETSQSDPLHRKGKALAEATPEKPLQQEEVQVENKKEKNKNMRGKHNSSNAHRKEHMSPSQPNRIIDSIFSPSRPSGQPKEHDKIVQTDVIPKIDKEGTIKKKKRKRTDDAFLDSIMKVAKEPKIKKKAGASQPSSDDIDNIFGGL